MNGVSSYGMGINSQVNFQAKSKLSNKQFKKMTNGIKENITKEQKTRQNQMNILEELLNKLQNQEITPEETLKKIAGLLDEVQGKLTPTPYGTEIGQRFKDVFV